MALYISEISRSSYLRIEKNKKNCTRIRGINEDRQRGKYRGEIEEREKRRERRGREKGRERQSAEDHEVRIERYDPSFTFPIIAKSSILFIQSFLFFFSQT